MKVYLVGVGLGNPDTMTVAARRAIEESPLLIGAPRLLEGYEGKTLLPLAVQVHHGVCDGFHLCRFLNGLQARLEGTGEG